MGKAITPPMDKTKKKPSLSVKEIKFIKALVEGKSGTQAALETTGATTYRSAATQAGRMLKKDDVQEALALAFEKHGITVDKAIEPIGKGLKAQKTIVHGKDSDEAFVEVVDDLELQLKASDRALKLMGVGKDNQPQGNTYNFINVAQTDKDEYGL